MGTRVGRGDRGGRVVGEAGATGEVYGGKDGSGGKGHLDGRVSRVKRKELHEEEVRIYEAQAW